MNPLIYQALRMGAAAATPTPTPTPTGPDFTAAIAMFGLDEAGAVSASQIGGIWSAHDTANLFQNSNGTGAVTADGDPVGYVADLSGEGNHLIQATSGARPTFRTSGGVNWLEFNGSSHFMRPAAAITNGSTFAQPWSRVSALRQIGWTSGRVIFGPFSGNSHLFLYQTGVSPALSLYNGVDLSNSNLAVGADGVVYEKANGVSSIVQVDKGTASSGNSSTGTNGNALTLGANGVGGNFGNFRFYGALMIGRGITNAERDMLQTLMGQLQGRTL